MDYKSLNKRSEFSRVPIRRGDLMRTKGTQGMTATAAASGTQTIQRAALLLRSLASNNRSGVRLVELAESTQLVRPTVHRILQGLIAEGLVVQEHATKKYHLGPLLYEMGLVASTRYDLRDLCQTQLQALAESTGDTVFLMVRSGFDSVCIDRKHGGFPVRVFVRDIGQRRPLGIGCGGLVLLSGLPDEAVDRIIAANEQRQAYSRETVTVRELRRRIRAAREMGYVAKTVDGAPGISALGVIIPGTPQEPIGALTVTALSARLSETRRAEVLSYMRRAVASIVLSVRKHPH